LLVLKAQNSKVPWHYVLSPFSKNSENTNWLYFNSFFESRVLNPLRIHSSVRISCTDHRAFVVVVDFFLKEKVRFWALSPVRFGGPLSIIREGTSLPAVSGYQSWIFFAFVCRLSIFYNQDSLDSERFLFVLNPFLGGWLGGWRRPKWITGLSG